jgi:hypothetical protein
MPLYALPFADLHAVSEKLGSALGLAFERRASSYLGDYCLYHGEQNSEIQIYRNEDPLYDPDTDPEPEQFFEPEFRSYLVLLDASVTPELLSRLRVSVDELFPGATLIREG